ERATHNTQPAPEPIRKGGRFVERLACKDRCHLGRGEDYADSVVVCFAHWLPPADAECFRVVDVRLVPLAKDTRRSDFSYRSVLPPVEWGTQACQITASA